MVGGVALRARIIASLWAPGGPFGGPFSNLGYFRQCLMIFERIVEDI